MQATLNGIVLADAPDDQLIKIEGNWYFPPTSIVDGALSPSATPYHCSWKGDCQYFDVNADGVSADQAWSYPSPIPASFERVGADYSNYVAFAPGVTFA